MIDGQPRGVLEKGSSSVAVRGAGGELGRVTTAATYDRVTVDLTGWQFVWTRRWLGYIAFAVAFAIACVLLSHWQLDRGNQAVSYNALVSANFDSTPAPLATALPTLTSYNGDQNFRRVSATGHYLAADQLYVRNRPRGDNSGFEVLTPLKLADGRIFIVDRGWVGASSDSFYPAAKPRPPAGAVTVVARLRATEPAFGGTPSIKNQIESIDLSQVSSRTGGQVYTGAYGLLDSQVPAATGGLKPVVASAPSVDEGLHWSYMVQWILFAVVGFLGLAYGIRTEFRRINEDDPAEQAREAERVRKRALKPFTDEESEDELIDGFVPLGRWGFKGAAIAAPPQRASLSATQTARTEPEVYVLQPAVDEPVESLDEPLDGPHEGSHEAPRGGGSSA